MLSMIHAKRPITSPARVLEVLGVKSPFSMMDPEVAVYGEGMKLWSGEEARGFARIWGLPSVLWSRAGGADR